MFEKHITTNQTYHIYEKAGATGYYRIYEVENGRYIDSEKYVPWIEWSGTPSEVNMDPEIVEPTPQPPTFEERLAAMEMALLEVSGA